MVVDVWCKYAKHRRCIYTRLHFQLFTNLQTHMTAACSPWFVFPVRVTQEARHRKRDSWRDQAARDEPAAVTVAEATKGASINGAGGANGELSTQSSPPDRLISSAARTIPVGLPMAAPALPGGLRPMNQLYTAPYHYVVNARGERVRVDGPRYPTATMTTAASALATRAFPSRLTHYKLRKNVTWASCRFFGAVTGTGLPCASPSISSTTFMRALGALCCAPANGAALDNCTNVQW